MNRLKHFTIAIDGPGGAGKSTVADNVAAKLGVLHLDTGAMYRAFALQALRDGLTQCDETALAELTKRIKIDITFVDGLQHTLVNGQDVTDHIRTPQISMGASDCATYSVVRRYMVALQQDIASRQSMILDGRDIGTKVLPDATLKIYLTASSQIRAKRRYDELMARGLPADYDTVLADVVARDMQDTNRLIDPLTAAEDAVLLDTSDMTQAQVEQTIIELLEKKLMQQENKPTASHPREKFTFFYRLAMWGSFFVFHVLMPVRYHNTERTEMNAPFILIGNHNHMLDPFLIGWKLKYYQIRYLGKKEIIKNPMMRAVYRNMLMIPVDRHNMDMHAVRACLKTLKENHVLGIFPEGTRYKKTLMEEMESGVAMIALRSNVSILPVYISGKPRFFRPIDCYYGEPFSLAEIAAKGVNKETCEEVLAQITALYRDMAEKHNRSGI